MPAESPAPRAAAAPLLVAVLALTLPACATVRVGTLQRSHGPQIRAHQVSISITKELP